MKIQQPMLVIQYLRAYRVTWNKYPSIIGIYGAKTCGQAKSLCFASIRAAGWKPQWSDLRAVRQPSYDNDAIAKGRAGLIEGWEL